MNFNTKNRPTLLVSMHTVPKVPELALWIRVRERLVLGVIPADMLHQAICLSSLPVTCNGNVV